MQLDAKVWVPPCLPVLVPKVPPRRGMAKVGQTLPLPQLLLRPPCVDGREIVPPWFTPAILTRQHPLVPRGSVGGGANAAVGEGRAMVHNARVDVGKFILKVLERHKEYPVVPRSVVASVVVQAQDEFEFVTEAISQLAHRSKTCSFGRIKI